MIHSGVLYVAALEDLYVEEAFLSADSVKRHCPHVPTVLFTDRPEHPLCASGAFDQVRLVKPSGDFKVSCSHGKLLRLRCLPLTPFERTLHLDADTRVLSNELPRLYELLEEFDVGMVEATDQDSYARNHYGQPMFSGGFVLYRRCYGIFSWLNAWARISERNFRLAMRTPVPVIPHLNHIKDDQIRRALLNMDQIALSEALSPTINLFELKVAMVDYSWLHRGPKLSEAILSGAHIWHSRKLESESRALELEDAFEKRKSAHACE